MVKDKSVLELGSGPGLCGLLCSHFSREVILSDYQDLVLDLLKKNATENGKTACGRLGVAKLDWNDDSELIDQAQV